VATVKKRNAAILVLLAGAACTPKAPPVVTPPPVTYAPRAPLPPGGAAASTVLPAYGADGVRITPNRGLSTEEHIWNFRVALNVAALNCRGGAWDELVTNYNATLKTFKNTLRIVNSNVDAEYRSKHGGGGKRVRDTKTTELYNYFALPAVKSDYCNAALQKSRDVQAFTTRQQFRDYAIGGLNDIDRVFLDFYDSYAKYQTDLANWNAQYNAPSSFGQAPQPTTPVLVPASSAPAPTPAPAPATSIPSSAPVGAVTGGEVNPTSAPAPEPTGGVIFKSGTGTP